MDTQGMETGLDGKKRCSVYYCDPQRPDQRGQSERAHVDLRKILPKKRTSFDSLTPWDMATIFSHLNSLPRPSLGGTSPIALAKAVFPSEFFDELGLIVISTKMIVLRPNLLENRGEESTN